MMDEPRTQGAAALYVGVGVGTYEHYGETPQAIAEVQEVAALLTRHGYTAHVVETPREEAVRTAFRSRLATGAMASGSSLVILWAGHAEPASEGVLRLIAHDTARNAAPELTASYVASVAARTGASQILIMLDTCYAGAGAAEAANVASRVLRELPSDPSGRWLGVLASAGDFERASDSAFGQILVRLLREGPTDPELRLRWSAHNAGVRGDDLIDAVQKEWSDPQQRPTKAETGNAWVMFPNPLFSIASPDRVVEHLLLAARGIDPGDEGSYFTGRVLQLDLLVSWMRTGQPGLFVVTGPAGSGKSAIIGRLVSLSNPDERARVLAREAPDHEDPGEGTIDAHVHARRLTTEQLVQQIDHQLEQRGVIARNTLGRPRNRGDLLGAIISAGRHPVLAVDGLDEAGAEAWRIVEDVLRPLSGICLVLISTRELTSSPAERPVVDDAQRGPSEMGTAGPSARSLMEALGAERVANLADQALAQQTRADVRTYVMKRLHDGQAPQMDAQRVADALLRLSDGQPAEGAFLLARVITAQLRLEPIDTSAPDWERRLARGIEDAFERDLKRVPSRQSDDHEFPTAARDLLTALAWSYGAGVPDDVWPVIATALAAPGAVYTRADAYWALAHVGRYVVEAGERRQAVYRLSHQRLADYLRPPAGTAVDRSLFERRAAAVASALVERYLQILDAGRRPRESGYLWRHCWQHCVDGGAKGVQAFRALVGRDRHAFTPALASALNNLGISLGAVGRQAEALALTEEAVQTYRELAVSNAAFVPALAGALNNLGISLGAVGRQAEAVAPTEEAVQVRRELAASNAAFVPDLASALNNLGIRLGAVGRRAEAVAPTEEAVQTYRELAASNAAFVPHLASALNNLGVRLDAVGRRAEAVAPTEEAVQTYRELAASNAAFVPDLAMALNNLGNRLSDVGRRAEAVAPTEEAVQAYRELAGSNAAFVPDLARALNNLGICLGAVGRRVEAVAPTEEAVQTYRELAASNAAFVPDLARALNNLGICLGEVGRRAEAVGPTEEAVQTYRELAGSNAAFAPDLAGALSNLGICLGKVGRRAEAVGPTEEAVQIRRELAASNAAFVPDLASALNNLGIWLGEVGRRAEAVGPTEEAVQTYRELAASNAAFVPDLATALNNLGGRLGAVGRRAEAVAPTEEAVQIRRELAASNAAFVPDLASALNNLGVCMSGVERRAEAVAPTEEAVQTYRELAASNGAFVPDLATALNNLGNRLSEVGRRAEAVAPAEEAVQTYRELAASDAAFVPELARACAALGATLVALGRHAKAALTLHIGIEALEPSFMIHIDQLASLMATLARDYLAAAAYAYGEVDSPVLGRIIEVLDADSHTWRAGGEHDVIVEPSDQQ